MWFGIGPHDGQPASSGPPSLPRVGWTRRGWRSAAPARRGTQVAAPSASRYRAVRGHSGTLAQTSALVVRFELAAPRQASHPRSSLPCADPITPIDSRSQEEKHKAHHDRERPDHVVQRNAAGQPERNRSGVIPEHWRCDGYTPLASYLGCDEIRSRRAGGLCRWPRNEQRLPRRAGGGNRTRVTSLEG